MKTKELSVVVGGLLIPAIGLADFSSVVILGGQLSNDPTSSKFNEYRDIRGGIFVPQLKTNVNDQEKHYFELLGNNLFRQDQNINARAGKYNRYRLDIEWDKIPHNLSNKAKTPYLYQGNGTYTVPATVPQTVPGFVKKLVPSAAEMTGTNDPAVAAYLTQYLHSTDLENSRNKQTADFEYGFLNDLKFRFHYSNEDRDGNKITYGPIGDRPPRTLNIQILEPIDYKTQELRFETDYVAKIFQVNASYFLSNFKDHIDHLTWQNIYTTPGATVDAWGGSTARNVGTYGKLPLPPDNRAQTASLTFGIDLPKNSQLGGNIAHSWMRQNKALLPYSTVGTTDGGIAWNDTSKLPRNTAEGKIDTKLYELHYLLHPNHRLNVRASARYYDLDNKTPEAVWKYVTQDTVGTTGSVNYVNKRKNVAYEFDQRNYRLDGDYYFNFWRSTVGAFLEREEINRRHREGNTKEHIYQMSLRSRPKNWTNFRMKYQYRNRDIDSYNTHAAAETYAYASNEATTTATDFNDPQFTFENHPDTRLFDLTDRKRHLVELQATANPRSDLDVMGSFRWRWDNFDSGVTPSKPLLNYAGSGSPSADDRNTQTPGNQLGLLSHHRQQYGLDATYTATPRLKFTAFTTYEQGQSRQRGLEFNENNKGNPTAVSPTNELGSWSRASSQWNARITDRTYTAGLGADYAIIQDKLKAVAGFVVSHGRINIKYTGFGTQSSVNPANPLADNHEYAFRSPSNSIHNRVTTNLSLEYQLVKDLSIAFGYLFEHYRLSDWQQEINTPWRESYGNQNANRDTSRSNQWGNRLPNLGSYLAPNYYAHAGTLSLIYKL